MKDAADDGGGPAGVVDGFDGKPFFEFENKLMLSRLESGVEGAGGLEERGTAQPDMSKD